MNILIMSQKGDCKDLAQLTADQGNTVSVWCKDEVPFDLLTLEGIETVSSWRGTLKTSEVAIFDTPEISRYFKAVSQRIPVVGGASGFHLFPSRQGDIYYRLRIPTMPGSKRRERITWGIYSDSWIHRGGDQKGDILLNQLSPYLSYIGYTGPFAVKWTRYRYSNFLIDSGSEMGYDCMVKDDSMLPIDVRLKEIIRGWH